MQTKALQRRSAPWTCPGRWRRCAPPRLPVTQTAGGTGNLGRAIIKNFRFSGNGFQLLAAFDVNPAVVGTEIAGVPVYHADRLEEVFSAHGRPWGKRCFGDS